MHHQAHSVAVLGEKTIPDLGSVSQAAYPTREKRVSRRRLLAARRRQVLILIVVSGYRRLFNRRIIKHARQLLGLRRELKWTQTRRLLPIGRCRLLLAEAKHSEFRVVRRKVCVAEALRGQV